MNNRLAFSVLILIIITISIAGAVELRETYHNGIYFNHEGKAETPAFFSTADTSYVLFAIPDSVIWPAGITKVSENSYWMTDNNSGSSKLHKIFYRMGDASPTLLDSYDAPILGYAGLEFDGEYLWAVYEQANKIFKIDRNNGESVDSFSLPLPDTLNPDRHAWGIAFDGEYFWHSQYGENSIIYKLDSLNFSIVDSIIPTAATLLGIAYREPYLYGIDMQNALIYQFDLQSLSEVDSSSWDVGYPLGLHFDSYTGNFINVSSISDYGGDKSVHMLGLTVGVDEDDYNMPSTVKLKNAYPNPFNASTNISFILTQPGKVTLDIYDILGRRTESLVDEYLPAGDHSILWQAGDIPTGVYFYRITAGDFQASKKITLLK